MQSDIFSWVGETLRRVRKERGKTLSQLAAEARVGKGQLSRIETGKQEVTLATLGRVLAAHGLTRQEFFRRYDLVEAEAGAIGRRDADRRPVAVSGPAPSRWARTARAALEQVEDFLTSAVAENRPVAKGSFETDSFVVLFRVLPRGAADEGDEDPKPFTPASS